MLLHGKKCQLTSYKLTCDFDKGNVDRIRVQFAKRKRNLINARKNLAEIEQIIA
jgi:hypothetical protein